MRISHKYKFIYFSKPRSASTSLRKLLDRYTDIVSEATGPYFHHATARELNSHFQQMGWDWNSYYKFTTVRNPWDLLVSLYHFGKRDVNNLFFWENGQKGIKYDPENLMSFDEYIRKKYVFEWYSLANFVLDENNQSLVDRIIKVEDIDKGIQEVFKNIGLPITDVPKLNITNHGNYRPYYDEETKNRVAKIFWYDIQVGGYEF